MMDPLPDLGIFRVQVITYFLFDKKVQEEK